MKYLTFKNLFDNFFLLISLNLITHEKTYVYINTWVALSFVWVATDLKFMFGFKKYWILFLSWFTRKMLENN